MRSHCLVAALALAVVSAVSVAACSKNTAPPPASNPGGVTPAVTPAADRYTIAPDLPPLPAGADNAPLSLAEVKLAYEFAARHPEVISYIPCFCGCERGGHKSNESCFIASRANGRVTWDTHGLNCDICLRVALETMQMHNAGAATSDIRKLIEAKYAASFPGHTPTPMPPAGGKGE
jgi:hypothetical protein